MLASIIVLAHNVMPHHHHGEINISADHHDEEDDHDHDHDHSDLGTHHIDSSFTEQSGFPAYKAVHSLEIVLPQLFLVLAADVHQSPGIYQLAANESPPLRYLLPVLSYRGPPVVADWHHTVPAISSSSCYTLPC